MFNTNVKLPLSLYNIYSLFCIFLKTLYLISNSSLWIALFFNFSRYCIIHCHYLLLHAHTRITCSDPVSHNRVQVLSIPVLLLACSQDWTCNLQMIVFLEALGINAYKRYNTGIFNLFPVMANGIRTGDLRGFNDGRSSKFRVGSWVRQSPGEGRCGSNNKDEDNMPKTLNDKK